MIFRKRLFNFLITEEERLNSSGKTSLGPIEYHGSPLSSSSGLLAGGTDLKIHSVIY